MSKSATGANLARRSAGAVPRSGSSLTDASVNISQSLYRYVSAKRWPITSFGLACRPGDRAAERG